jgi:hypothetical protein
MDVQPTASHDESVFNSVLQTVNLAAIMFRVLNLAFESQWTSILAHFDVVISSFSSDATVDFVDVPLRCCVLYVVTHKSPAPMGNMT